MRVKKERLKQLAKQAKGYTKKATETQKEVGKEIKKMRKEWGMPKRIGGFKPATKKEIAELVKKSLKKKKEKK